MRKLEFCLFIFFIVVVTKVKADGENIVFLRNSILYIENYSQKNEHKIIDLASMGDSNKYDFHLIKAEYDTAFSNIARCYVFSKISKGMPIISTISFSIESGELCCYQENKINQQDVFRIYFGKDSCIGKMSKPMLDDYTQPINGFVYTINGAQGICKISPDLVRTLGTKYYSTIFDHPDDDSYMESKFLSWGYLGLDLSPNENYLSCDFCGERTAFYWGNSGNIFDIYEFSIKDSTGKKIIEGGRYSNYSQNSKFILFQKVKQTWGFYHNKNLGFYIYDRNSKQTSFFKYCDEACFIRYPKDYMPCPYY
ncbi:MAG TPA: hypothetical protein PKI01_00760 [Bacteroidales bacterium]|nr:hypothetical protein [Bacteroidales bacterium]